MGQQRDFSAGADCGSKRSGDVLREIGIG